MGRLVAAVTAVATVCISILLLTIEGATASTIPNNEQQDEQEETIPCFQDTCRYPEEPLGSDFGIKQFVDDSHHLLDILEIIHRTKEYISESVLRRPDDYLPDDCWNHVPDCSFLALVGRCESNSEWMRANCAPACQVCPNIYEQQDRCDRHEQAARDAIQPGQLYKMFETIVQSSSPKATIVSQPSPENNNNDDDDLPWIVTLDDFLTDQECQEIIQLAGDFDFSQERYELDSGETTNLDRFFCVNPECDQLELFQTFRQRLHELTDFAQIVRYQQNQQLAIHHDWVDEDILHPPGPRVLTVNLYLSDVEEGGETQFPDANNKTVQPKMGRLAIWPNTLNDDPSQQDHRTLHRSLPVTKGIKYGINMCLYLRDFRGPFDDRCTT